MPRKSYYRRYYDERDYWYDLHRQRTGCWYRLKQLVTNVFVALLALLGGALFIGLIYLVYTYRASMGTVLLVIIAVGGLILVVAFLRFLIGLITSIANTISAARVRAAQAGRAKVELSKRKLERDAYRQRLQQAPPPRAAPAPASVRLPSPSETLVRQLTTQESQASGVPGMPRRTTVLYRDIEQRVKPGQLVALIRANGTLRLEAWSAFKILLVLGGSSSGKSTTIAEKVLGFVNGGGALVPCDPHDSKEDSLFKKIAPLAPALYPGAVFAVAHGDILNNMRLVRAILEDRVSGGDASIPVLLVVEELNRLLRDHAIAKEMSLILEALGEEGRGYNVFALVGCQRVTGLSDIRKAFISFIVHRCDESEARLVIPARYAKYCSELRPGQCFVKDSDGETEAGLQALVTRQDVERASLSFPGSRITLSQRPTARLNPLQVSPLELEGRTPRLHRRPGVPGQPRTVQTPSRAVHRTHLEPVQHQMETPLAQRPNPSHTWSPESAESQKPPNVSPPLQVPENPPIPPPAHLRDTEALTPDNLSNSQQLEILALLRKKKSKQ